MNTIASLERRITETAALLEKEQAALRDDPRNFARDLGARSLGAHLMQLRAELRNEKLARSVEVFQLRLMGRVAQHGSIPLHLLSKLSSALADAIHASAQKLRTGARVRRISPDVVAQLDLRLAGVVAGSTNLVVKGNLAPDLFGESVLEDSLELVFSLLNSDPEAELEGAVGEIGIRSAHEVRDLLRTLRAANLEAELHWTTPTEQERFWRGTHHRISSLSSALGTFTEVEPEVITVVGTPITVSLRRPFELEAEGKVIKAQVPGNVKEQLERVHLGQQVVAKLFRTTIVNAATGTRKVDYALLEIAPTGQEALQAKP